MCQSVEPQIEEGQCVPLDRHKCWKRHRRTSRHAMWSLGKRQDIIATQTISKKTKQASVECISIQT